jgi:uncharacterized protein
MKEILIDDIPEEGLDLEASEADPWFNEIVKDALGDAFDGDTASVKVRIDRVGGNVNLDGAVELTSHPTCDRCCTRYEFRESFPLHAVLAPLYENRRQKELAGQEEIGLVKEDLDFQFYEGDRFDLGEVIREQMVLDEPMKHLCSEDCKGLCQKCGKNLNEGTCGCAEERAGGGFAVLKDISVNPQTKH